MPQKAYSFCNIYDNPLAGLRQALSRHPDKNTEMKILSIVVVKDKFSAINVLISRLDTERLLDQSFPKNSRISVGIQIKDEKAVHRGEY